MGLNFPESRSDWKFDLVGFLAIIGESVVSEVVQPLTSTRTVFLPRLLPAPHALIRPSRRAALPSTPVQVFGVQSGLQLESLPYFPSIIHQLDLLQPFEFREMAIQSRSDTLVADKGILATVWPLAPLKLITICSSAWTAGILVWAIVLGDGPAVVSIVLVSLTSSFHSAASFWQSRVIPRRSPSDAPPSDIVIRTREGAFIVVHSNEEVIRLLYSGEASCHYVLGGTAYQILISVGTVFLMVGIVMMSNCTWEMQVILGASYLVMNGIYMLCALTPAVSRLWHWNLGSLNITAISIKQSINYTQALWEAIYATKETRWVLTGKLVPSTDPWKRWLDEAKANCYNPDWDCEGARDMWMRHFLSAPVEGSNERASQAVSKEAVDVSDVSMRQLDMPKKRTTLI